MLLAKKYELYTFENIIIKTIIQLVYVIYKEICYFPTGAIPTTCIAWIASLLSGSIFNVLCQQATA